MPGIGEEDKRGGGGQGRGKASRRKGCLLKFPKISVGRDGPEGDRRCKWSKNYPEMGSWEGDGKAWEAVQLVEQEGEVSSSMIRPGLGRWGRGHVRIYSYAHATITSTDCVT